MLLFEEFSDLLRKRLLIEVDQVNLKLKKEDVLRVSPSFREVNNEMRFFLDERILSKLSEDFINEMEKMWNEIKQKYSYR